MSHLTDEAAGRRPAAFAELLALRKFIEPPAEGANMRDVLQADVIALIHDPERSPGVRELLERIHNASFSVRDRLSADTWRILNRLEADAGQPPGHLPLVFANATLNTLILDLAAFSGMEMENMTRGHGWAFLDLGRRIERGLNLAQLIEAALRCTGARELLLEPLLEVADSVITYRRRYFAEPRLAGVLDLLLLDPTNPRALAFQLATLERNAASLPASPNPEGVADVQQRLTRLAGRLDCVRAEEFDAASSVEETAHWLASLAGELSSVSDLLTHVYFSQVLPRVS